jgi:hypothetical protein
MMTIGIRRFMLGLLAALVSCQLAAAQEVTGNIAGSVTDASGAVVPNAKVTVTETARGIVLRDLQTNQAGLYSATLLPVGTYSVTVEAGGFKKAKRDGIELDANAKYTADFHLEVGAITEEVSVEAGPAQVELQTAQISGLISGTQVRELALNNRHFAQLVALQPGVSSNLSDQIYVGTTNPSGGNNIVGLAVNGARQSQNNWTVDGADNVDRGSNITIQQYPSIDAIEEIKIVRSPYSAESGRAGGGQISVVTKSGTNELHGSAYEFLRNDKLNANNFFNNLNSVKRPALRYNNFGYTAGGPVYIPGVYDGRNKTFFFFSEEFRRVINYNASNVQVPTSEERQGIFANPVCIALSADFSTCTDTGTRIANISPLAQAYVKDIFSKLPAPTNGNNLFVPLRGVFNARQEIVRIDHNVGQRLSLSGRYLHDAIPTIEPGGLFTNNFSPGIATTQTNSPGRSLVIRGTSSFSSTLYNEAVWAWSRGGIFSHPIGLAAKTNSPDIKPTLVFPGNPERIPTIAFTGGFTSVSSFGPYDNFSYDHAISDNITKVLGRHMLKFGGQFHIYRKSENQLADNAGGFSITNTPRPGANVTAQQSWAYFLLGYVSTYSQLSQDLTADLRSKTFEAYLQDDVKVRPNLTLNFGLRYSNYREPVEAAGLLTNFIPSRFDPSKAFQVDPVSGNRIAGTGDPFNGVIQAGKTSPFGNKVARENNRNFAPRVGLAWDPFGNGKTSVRAGYGMFYDAVLVGPFQTNIGANPTETFRNVSISNTRLDNPSAGSPAVSLAPANLRVWDPNYKDPYVQQWSLEIQRQVTSDTTVSVGYVGSKGTHLIGIADINQVPPGAAAAAGLVPAGGYITSGIRPRLNILRPYRGFNAINAVMSAFNSNYHSLQTSLNKRIKKSGNIGIAYTWSKNMTDNQSDRSNAAQNTYNWHAGEYSRAFLDRRHVLTASYVYPLPFFENSSSPLKYALGGWELSGIFTYNSGLPQTVTSSLGNDPGGLGSVNNAASTAGVRPDLIGDVNAGSDIRTINKWFNTAAFAEVPVGANRPGNAGRGIVEAPGIVRWDFSVFKKFPIRERASIQLRGEAFNFLNHANFNAPTLALGNANFGRILGARDPRQVQVAAKLVF